MLAQVKDVACLVRDIGVIIGVPAIIAVGINLYELQSKALEQQVKANEATIKALETQNSALNETQCDRAVTLLKSEKEFCEIEKDIKRKRSIGATPKATGVTPKK